MKIINKLVLFLVAGMMMMSACKKDDDTAEKQAEIDEQIIVDYLAANNIEATQHESGMYYVIHNEGTGENPTINSTVEVFYEGFLTNGNVFDKTTTSPVSFPLRNLIQGWQIGIPLLKEGGSATFYIPSALGYGTQGSSSIPANSVIIFDIDLVSIL
jgi:FKBP-type peptidyl-prolyl cis-trans isomerase